jgi:flagellar biosynthetic protein FliR
VEHYATAQTVFAAGLVFARMGSMIMLIPGIGETFIPIRIRLAFAFALAMLLIPIVGATAPALPATVSGVAGAVIKETLIGLMIGAVLRVFMSSLATAGEIISIQSTLGFAQTANPTQAAPSTSIGTFLGLLGLVLIMTSNLHHLFLDAIVRSYTLFPFSRDLQMADANTLMIQTISKSFALGLQLAAPIVAFSLIFNVATGLIGRVMPQFQIFFVSSPLMILLSLSIFALSLGVIGVVWIDRYRDLLILFAR